MTVARRPAPLRPVTCGVRGEGRAEEDDQNGGGERIHGDAKFVEESDGPDNPILQPCRGAMRAGLFRLPRSVHQQRGGVTGEVGGDERQGLTFGAGEIRADADVRMPDDGTVKEKLARGTIARLDVGGDGEAVVARREHVARLEGERVAFVAGDGSGDDDVAFVVARLIMSQSPWVSVLARCRAPALNLESDKSGPWPSSSSSFNSKANTVRGVGTAEPSRASPSRTS